MVGIHDVSESRPLGRVLGHAPVCECAFVSARVRDTAVSPQSLSLFLSLYVPVLLFPS